jgi:hypothetical protein
MRVDEIIADEMRKAGMSEEAIQSSKKIANLGPVAGCSRQMTPREEAEFREEVKALISMPRHEMMELLKAVQGGMNKLSENN